MEGGGLKVKEAPLPQPLFVLHVRALSPFSHKLPHERGPLLITQPLAPIFHLSRPPLTARASGQYGTLGAPSPASCYLISHKIYLKSFGKSEFSHKSINLFFILVIVKDMVTDL